MSYNLRTGLSSSSNVNVSLQNIDASNVSSGVFLVARIPTLPKDKVSTDDTWAVSDIPVVPKDKVSTDNTWAVSDIPLLPADKIASGTLDMAVIPVLNNNRIPNLSATKITSGVLDISRIPSLDAIHIPNLSATKITSDTLDADRIPTLDKSKISSTGTWAVADIPTLSYLTAETLSLTDFQDVVDASTSFSDFKTRVANL
jgi:hypothetical protein